MSSRLLPAAAVVALLLAACGGEPGEGVPAFAEERPFPFPAGSFQFTTTKVEDGCADGSLNLLFMPRGESTPWDWTFPITLYPPEELPRSYAIQLREPFGEMNVTVNPVSAVRERVRGAENTGVLLGRDQFGECVADLDADVDLTLVDSDHARGNGALFMKDPRGDDKCPLMASECKVLLTLEVARVESGAGD